jgi:hypothetical protein
MDSISEPRRSKLINTTLYIFYALFALFAVLKILLPKGSDGWSDPPIVDHVFILLFGICLSIYGIGYSYHSWMKDAEKFENWRLSQNPLKRNWMTKLMMFGPSPAYILWSARILIPLMVLFGIGIIGFASYLIIIDLVR